MRAADVPTAPTIKANRTASMDADSFRSESMRKRKNGAAPAPEEFVAGNGLLHRRALLGGGIVFASAMASGAATTSAAAEPLKDPPWSRQPGEVTPVLQTPSPFEKKVVRILSNPKGEPRTQHARAPLQYLDGTITPNPLHFTILHSGIPDIDPAAHRFVIHGMVKQPLEYTVEALLRYPMVTRKHFVECGGNSAGMFSNEPLQATVQQLHGLSSCAEWTGIPLSTVLDEAGIDPKAKWMVAEGADSLLVARSIPLKKGYEDALIALYQNGERLMPGNGYPMRLLLPGYEGNMNTKFLRRIQITDQPAMTFYETRNYSPLLPDGKAYRFYFVNEVKSFITKPSFGMGLKEPGYYEISGIAYSGTGTIVKVLVSADGGKSWGEAAVEGPATPKAFTRFRMPWHWDGQPAIITSRAWDDSGEVQPLRADFVAKRGVTKQPMKSPYAFANQHYNSLTSWSIDAKGEIKHVYV
jgi:sulfane dehydrogenase subunit SoxC